MTKKKHKFVPSIVVPSDDLILTDDDGNEHRPHEGEWVRFRKGVPLAIMRLVSSASGVNELPDGASDEQQREMAAQYSDLSAGIIKALCRQIIDLNWTDDNYDPWPSPRLAPEAFAEALWNAADYEIAWLQEHMTDGANISKN